MQNSVISWDFETFEKGASHKRGYFRQFRAFQDFLTHTAESGAEGGGHWGRGHVSKNLGILEILGNIEGLRPPFLGSLEILGNTGFCKREDHMGATKNIVVSHIFETFEKGGHKTSLFPRISILPRFLTHAPFSPARSRQPYLRVNCSGKSTAPSGKCFQVVYRSTWLTVPGG